MTSTSEEESSTTGWREARTGLAPERWWSGDGAMATRRKHALSRLPGWLVLRETGQSVHPKATGPAPPYTPTATRGQGSEPERTSLAPPPSLPFNSAVGILRSQKAESPGPGQALDRLPSPTCCPHPPTPHCAHYGLMGGVSKMLQAHPGVKTPVLSSTWRGCCHLPAAPPSHATAGAQSHPTPCCHQHL